MLPLDLLGVHRRTWVMLKQKAHALYSPHCRESQATSAQLEQCSRRYGHGLQLVRPHLSKLTGRNPRHYRPTSLGVSKNWNINQHCAMNRRHFASSATWAIPRRLLDVDV